MQTEDIHAVMKILREDCSGWVKPALSILPDEIRNPYTLLISCIISLRTKDAVTAAASARLFERASTPSRLAELSVGEIAGLIYPAGFYNNKAAQIQDISARIANAFGGVVPDSVDELRSFRGVGRKTANLVVTLGYGRPGICVDTHVHRIVNRWGYVATKTPDSTEQALRGILPDEYWIEINDLLVCYGQNRCFPVSPVCSACGLFCFCSRAGIKKSR
mgnify:CR=1 FL=1